MASSSSSPSPSSISTPVKVHDVFLSFTGQDTREKFTSHLHKSLVEKNIETYIDYRIPKGGNISKELIEAIEGSRISVIIFSENYAYSTWCLDEVVCILKCKKEHGQIVVPVFYDVEPTIIRKQLKTYKKAFTKHEKRFKQSMDKVDKWRDALKEAADVSGWDSQTFKGTESEFVEAIAKDILEKLKGLYSASSDEFEGLVGINKSIEEMEQLLCIDDSTTVRFIGIWGMGGLGKTTLARVLFKRFSSKFQGCCFLANVREASGIKHERLDSLKTKLFSDIFEEKGLETVTPFHEKKLRQKKVLIVLDDVDAPGQLQVLAADHHCFGLGSRIIVTTRNEQVLRNRADGKYDLQGLGFDDALQLLKLNAFDRNTPTTPPIDTDVKMLERVVKHANGNPLALTVLGSFLRSRRKENWEIELKRLEDFPPKAIYDILKISFDALEKTEQDIFLDVVCFFSNVEFPACRKVVECRLGAHRKYVEIGIDSLIDRSLITHVKDNNTLVIHDLLLEMGWEIERRQSIEEPGKCSRLWREDQLNHVFKNNTGPPSAVEGISCLVGWLKSYWSPTMFEEMHRLWLLDLRQIFFRSEPVHVEYLPDSLKCLIWPYWSWKSLPSNFMAHNLVELRMPFSKLEKLWSEVQLGNLKFVQLNRSRNLIDVSALSQAPNLVSVELSFCESLRQVPPLRFRICDELTSLDESCLTCGFSGCYTLGCLQLDSCTHLEVVEKISGNLNRLDFGGTSVEELPSSIWFLDNLEYLDLSRCHNLKSLPSDIQKLKSLRGLNLNECVCIDKLPVLPGKLIWLDLGKMTIEQVPSSSIEHLSSLETLSFSGCSRLKSLPIGISKLKSLQKLDLDDCNQLEIFPSTLEHLETLSLTSLCSLCSLETLLLERSNIEGIPASIKNLSKLIKLVVRGCNRLKSLPELSSSLELLDARECTSLETISNSRDALIQGLNGDNHAMTNRRFLYLDCLKLDQNSRNSIVSEFQLRALDRGIKAVLPCSVFKESDWPGVGFCFPGNEIPKWFTYQSKSSSINIKLPSNWPNTNFLGFALCAARSSISHRLLFCEGNFKTNNGKSWESQWNFKPGGDSGRLRSSNIFMWYENGNYLDIVQVSFHFTKNVTACGIRLLYRQDAEELGIANNLGISNVEKTGVINSDTDDRRSIRQTSEPSQSSNEADLGEKPVTTSRGDGSGEALAEEADELGGFGEESVTGLTGMGHQHMDYDNVQIATGVDHQRRRTVGALGRRRWTCWCIGKKKEEEEEG